MHDIDEMERRCIDSIKYLQQRYADEAKPYIEQLTRIRELRPQIFTADGKIYQQIIAKNKPADAKPEHCPTRFPVRLGI